MTQPALVVTDLRVSFGGVKALEGVTLDVAHGEIVAVIGPNGAGKTTLFNCVTGLYRPAGGDVLAARPGEGERSLVGLKPNQVTERGLARTFQNIRLFPNMTVLENVMVGRHCRTSAGILGALLRDPRTRAEEADIADRSAALLARVGLGRYANDLARNLPYGAQRRLEIARALATEPFLLLLDEPAAGMNIQETAELDALIARIRAEQGLAILLIEHDMRLVMNLSDRIFVLDHGRKIAEGTPLQIRDNEAVIKAYLGEEFGS